MHTYCDEHLSIASRVHNKVRSIKECLTPIICHTGHTGHTNALYKVILSVSCCCYVNIKAKGLKKLLIVLKFSSDST